MRGAARRGARHIGALLTPLKAVLQLAQGLTKSRVTPEQQRLAAGMIDVVTFVVWA